MISPNQQSSSCIRRVICSSKKSRLLSLRAFTISQQKNQTLGSPPFFEALGNNNRIIKITRNNTRKKIQPQIGNLTEKLAKVRKRSNPTQSEHSNPLQNQKQSNEKNKSDVRESLKTKPQTTSDNRDQKQQNRTLITSKQNKQFDSFCLPDLNVCFRFGFVFSSNQLEKEKTFFKRASSALPLCLRFRSRCERKVSNCQTVGLHAEKKLPFGLCFMYNLQ